MSLQTKALPIAALQRRLDELHQHTSATRQRTLTGDEQGQLVEQLQFTLRELAMAEEELRRQDEALTHARRVAEEERRHFQRLFDLALDGYVITDIQAEIEERQRAEAALRESEKRYRDLFENANDMMTTIALDGTFLSVNRKTEQLLGYSREELIGQDSHKFATPASAAIGDERTRRVFAGEIVPPIFALELVRRDGTIVPVEARIRFMRDQEGKPIGFHGIYRDVTERKRAEDTLRKAHEELESRVQARTEELVRTNTALLAEVGERKRAEEAARAAEIEYRSIFENATEGIYRSSIDGHQIRANPALVKLNGYSSEEEQIASVNNIATEWYVDPYRRDEFKRQLEEHEQVTNFESEIYRHKTRERIWISENARLVRDKTGNPLYYEGTVQDITARRRAEEALRQAHAELERRVQERTAELTRTNDILLAEVAERQRTAQALDQLRRQHESILNSAGEGIVGADLEGKAIFVNPEAARLLGREVDELLGHSLHLLMHHSKPNGTPYPVEEGPFLATLRNGQVVHVTDEVFWRKDGTAFPIECLSTPIRSGEGDIVGAVVTFRDITQRKEVDRLKDELISIVSHELRTPLTSLRGFAELLLEREFPPEKQQDFVGVIHKESLRLTNLINDFLDLQRIEAGRQPYFFAPVAVEPLVYDTAAVFTKEGDPHVVRLDLPTSLPRVHADADRLRQVLTNLLSNAIKFSPKGGEVVVGARHEGGDVVLWVQDHGIGIPEDAFPNLFNKFYRIDNRATRDIGGTGLGLALVKELISAHQGRVWVESQVGRGTTFSFTIPVAAEERQG
jgi:PAS domain S-box-containing protein